jgi:hypothetical protein
VTRRAFVTALIALLGPGTAEGHASLVRSSPARRAVLGKAPPRAPGRHTVRFRVLSVDGHVVESSFSFTVTPKGR